MDGKADLDLAGDAGVARRARRRAGAGGAGAGPLPHRAAHRAGPPRRGPTCPSRPTPPTSTPSRWSGSRRSRATSRWSSASATTSAGTPWPWWCAPTRRPTWAATSPASPRRPCSTTSATTTSGGPAPRSAAATWSSSRATRRPASTPAPSCSASSPRSSSTNFRQEVGGRGALLLPAPLAHAELLAVPHRVDGARPAHGHLPGPLHALPAGPRAGRDRRPQGLGALRRRRDGRAGVDAAPSAWPGARSSTTSSSWSTATCSGSTGRCAATARSSRSWRASSAAPAGTSSRWSGAATGTRCWPATPRGSCSGA